MHCTIWDLDNCLSDDRARIPLIDRTLTGDARWDAYHAACGADPAANLSVFFALHQLAPRSTPVFITSRPEAVRDETEAWIKHHIGAAALAENGVLMLYTRPNGNIDDSLPLKQFWLGRLRSAGWVPLLAFDDRPDIVEMYKRENVAAMVLKIHDDYSPHEHGNIAVPPAPGADIDALADLRPQHDPSPGPARILELASETFTARNESYGAAYREVGGVLAGMFPSGLTVQGAADWGRLAIMILLTGKLHRYARNFPRGGHIDSVRDAAVYSAMLEELTRGGLAPAAE